MTIQSKYYVYVAYGVEEEVLYVGKGSGMRYSHCLHGGSANPNINRYYFQNGEEGSISVSKVKYFETDEEALECEKHLIKALKPPFNVDFVESSQRNNFHTSITPLEKLYYGFSTDFVEVLKEYIKALEDGDIDIILLVEQRSSVHKNFVEVLGADRIKSIGMNKTKLTKAYNLTNNLNKNFLEIKSRLSSLRVGKKYTSTDIVNLLQSCYDDLNIDRKAVSNDIKNYFIVNKTQVVSEVDGKRKQGFKIVSDLYK